MSSIVPPPKGEERWGSESRRTDPPPAPPSGRGVRRLRLRLLKWLAVALLLVFVVMPLGLGYSFVYIAPRPIALAAQAAQVGRRYDDVSFASRADGITLYGWLFHAARPNGRSVILAPGWLSNRVAGDYMWMAKDLVAHGYDVLMFDFRAQGTSGGDHPTLGDRERFDVLGAYDFMRGRGYVAGKMLMFGVSMGGAAVLLASPQLPDVGAIVTDSAFAELRLTLINGLARFFIPELLDGPTLLYAPLFGVNPDLRPVDAVRSQPQRAFLFYHGDADQLVGVAQAYELRNASSNPQSDLVVVSGARHTKAYIQNPSAYLKRLYQFLDQQLR